MKWSTSILAMTVATLVGVNPPITAADATSGGPVRSHAAVLHDAQAAATTAPQTKNSPGVTTLMPVVRRGDLAGVQALLAQGADPNEYDVRREPLLEHGFRSESPLLLAVERGDEPMVRLLLSVGARARWRDARGQTLAELARSRRSSDSLIDLLSRAGEREFSLIPDWPLPEPLALAALRHVAGTYGDATARQRLDLERLRRIDQIVDVLAKLWPPRLRERPPSLGWSLTRNVNSLEWAIRNGNNEMLAAIVADLETKRQDCLSSPDGAFGEVKISVRTILPDGAERRGLVIRYIERFYWDLRLSAPAVASQWKELAGTTAVVAEPVPAGDYIIVARSADGKNVSEERPISVSRNRSTQFEVPLR